MPLTINLLKQSCVLVISVMLCGCASGRLSKNDQSQLVENDVTRLIKTWLSKEDGEKFAGDAVANNARSLLLAGWHVEDVVGNIDYITFKDKYSSREYILDVPKDRLGKPESGWDFLTSAMFDSWVEWNTLFWECFLTSKRDFDRIAQGHYFRVIAPAADRVYDIVIIRPVDSQNNLIADPGAGEGVDSFWNSIKPVKDDEFPSIFGPVRFVRPTASNRFSVNHYTVLNVYDKRYFAFGTTPIFHSEYGKSHGRDCYILVFLSKKEFVVVQTILYKETSLSTLVGDLRKIVQ